MKTLQIGTAWFHHKLKRSQEVWGGGDNSKSSVPNLSELFMRSLYFVGRWKTFIAKFEAQAVHEKYFLRRGEDNGSSKSGWSDNQSISSSVQCGLPSFFTRSVRS